MKLKAFPLFVVVLSLFLILTGCQAAGEANEVPAEAAAPVEVTESFYEWYFDYIGEPGSEEMKNPLVDHAYRSSPYLTAVYITKVDTILSSFEGGGYDPFLQAQAIPQGFTVEEDYTAENDACAIVHQQFGSTIHDLTVDLVKQEGVWKINNVRRGNPRTPDGVARLFYDWYIDYARNQGNPLVDEVYKDSPFLSQTFIAQVEDTLAGFDRGGYDPILLAQDIPFNFFVETPDIEGDQASVVMRRYWSGNPEPSPMIVHLRQENGRWQITAVTVEESAIGLPNPAAVFCEAQGFTSEIRTAEDGSQYGVCILADGTECDEWAYFRGSCPAPDSAEPAAIVGAFYDWYLAYMGDRSSDDFRNPLVDKAYQQNVFLTPVFITQVDELLAGFEGGSYDPFLCAQDIPHEVTVDGTIFTESGAKVAVHTDFANHAFVVELKPAGEDSWLINNVVCPGTPQSNALIFYTWYLAYTRNCCILGMTDPYEQQNPLVDGAYHNAPFINPSFAADVEAELAQMQASGGYGHDPILQAQNFPPDFSVEAGEGEGVVIVDMAFVNPHRLQVQMKEVNGQWLVSGITRLEEPGAALSTVAQTDTTGWLAITDAEHGFSFLIPPDWVAQEQNLQGPGMPDDWPVVQQYLVMSATMAEELAAGSGPPSGDENPPVPPFTVSFLQGDQAAFDRVYVSAAFIDTLQMNGQTIVVQHQEGEYALPRYVFQDEQDPQRWVIVEDLVNEFPGREVQAAEVFGVLDGILSTVAFDH